MESVVEAAGTNDSARPGGGRFGPSVAAAGVGLAVALFALPRSLTRWWLSPDVVEHLTIAHNWVQGAGFVDPVQWNFYLDRSAPLPALAVRAPAVSLLAALPLSLGGGVGSVCVVHALWACAVAAAAVLVARRFMSLPAAVAVGLLLGLSPAWLRAAVHPLTEVSAVAGLLLVLATARGALRSVPGALACSAATLLAYAARPVLLALALAVLVAGLWEVGRERGVRAALRHRPLQAYALGVLALTAATHAAVTAATGLAPYAGYGVTRELFGASMGFEFQKEYVGGWTFLAEHRDEVAARIARFAREQVRVLLFDPRFHFAGWLIVPGVLHALWRRGPGAFEERVAAFGALGFVLVTLSYFAAFDAWRYPMLAAVCALLCGVAAVDTGCRRLAARRGGARAAALRLAPLAAALLVLASSTPESVHRLSLQWSSYRQRGTLDARGGEEARAVAALCPALRPDGIVAAVRPWLVALHCGNASVRTPPDLTTSVWRDRFIARTHVRYFLGDDSPITQWLKDSPRVQRIAEAEPFAVYEVLDPTPAPRPWTAPAPLACAGLSDCAARPPRAAGAAAR